MSDSANPRGVGGYDARSWNYGRHAQFDDFVAHDWSGGAYGVAVAGDYAYVSTDRGGLQIIDVSDPVNPRRVGGNSAFNSQNITVYGDRVYAAAGEDGLMILNKFAMLRFGPASVRDDGLIRLPLAGLNGQRVRIERSANLMDWQEWKTAFIGEEGCEITDRTTRNSHWFYRAVQDNRQE